MIRTYEHILYPIEVSDITPLIWLLASCSCIKMLMKVLHLFWPPRSVEDASFWRAGVFLSKCHTDNFRRSCIESSINFDLRTPTPLNVCQYKIQFSFQFLHTHIGLAFPARWKLVLFMILGKLETRVLIRQNSGGRGDMGSLRVRKGQWDPFCQNEFLSFSPINNYSWAPATAYPLHCI
jgi:hypothetical protein